MYIICSHNCGLQGLCVWWKNINLLNARENCSLCLEVKRGTVTSLFRKVNLCFLIRLCESWIKWPYVLLNPRKALQRKEFLQWLSTPTAHWNCLEDFKKYQRLGSAHRGFGLIGLGAAQVLELLEVSQGTLMGSQGENFCPSNALRIITSFIFLVWE